MENVMNNADAQVNVFLDSNVIFSICWSGVEKSRSWMLYELQRDGVFSLFVSQLVHDEALHNLKIRRTAGIKLFNELMRETTLLPDIAPTVRNADIDALPEKDGVILATAISSNMNFFLTGNTRDFRQLYHKKISGTMVLTPADFLNRNF